METKQETKSRPRLAARYKLVIWLVVLIALWQLIQKESVADAILAFCLAGVVPGTNTVLSPDDVIRLVAVVLVLGAFLLMIKPTHRAIKRRRQLSDIPAYVAAPVTVMSHELRDAIEAAHVEVVATESKPKRASKGTPKLLITLRRTMQNLWSWCKTAYVLAARGAVVTGGWLVRTSIAAWHWLSPRLWHLDSWLEIQTRRFTAWEAERLKKHDNAQLFVSLVREYQKPLAKYSPKILWMDAKRDFREFKAKATALYKNLKKSKTSQD